MCRTRSKQVEHDPAGAIWVTGAIWDERQQVAIGRAGYHRLPIRRGWSRSATRSILLTDDAATPRAALEALLQRAAREPQVHTVRVTISPDNVASYHLVSLYGFTEVGEQWDGEEV